MDLFPEPRDYLVFTHYLKQSLLPKPPLQGLTLQKRGALTFYPNISLLCYCLMPNHFHFLIHQIEPTSITLWMRSLIVRYVRYFNTHYQRRGPLFESRYKAVLISSDEQLLHTSKYIHQNPTNLNGKTDLVTYPYSSLSFYTQPNLNSFWIRRNHILSFFSKTNPHQDYKTYVLEIQDFLPDF